jgi:hypothetical protein
MNVKVTPESLSNLRRQQTMRSDVTRPIPFAQPHQQRDVQRLRQSITGHYLIIVWIITSTISGPETPELLRVQAWVPNTFEKIDQRCSANAVLQLLCHSLCDKDKTLAIGPVQGVTCGEIFSGN